jgi:plastocyanin
MASRTSIRTGTVGDREARPPTSPAVHRVVVTASLVAVAADVVLQLAVGELIPPPALFAALTVLAVAASRRWPRGGVIALAVLGLVATLGAAPFLLGDLASPADTIAFVTAVASAGGRLLAVVVAVLGLRGRDEGVRTLATASLVVLGLAVVAATAVRLTTTSDALEAGDVEVVAEAIAFPDAISVADDGAVFVDNRDRIRHTFAVEGTDLDVEVPPGAQRRIELALTPGTYTFLCTVPGHERMTGTLEVTS